MGLSSNAYYYYDQVRKRGRVVSMLPTYLFRAFTLGFRRLLKREAPYTVRSGFGRFKMNYLPLKNQAGSQGYYFFRERYEHLIEFGSMLLSKSGDAIDGGANQGLFSVAFASKTKGKVVAVEPIPWQVERIKKNLELNELTNCTAVEAAISDSLGTAKLDIASGDVRASLADGPDSENFLEVTTTTIDEIVESQRLNNLELLKLDVEGAELSALIGAHQTLKTQTPIVCVEAWDFEMFAEIREILLQYGYAPYFFSARGELSKLEGSIRKPEDNAFFMTDSGFSDLRSTSMGQGR